METTKKQIQETARFSNFAQKFKMIVWELGVDYVKEAKLDEIALELWEYLKKNK